ncbi:MAG TPA: polyprenyl synthetase family protein, partial [Methylomirabilota bacterium]|nr:polyprenyl synthetase family protein [Methylomirabilota bacterium]
LLIHDDIMDHAELRRGQPTAHVVFRELHEARRLRGSAESFGGSVAILVGDLAYALAFELFGQALTAAAQASSPGLERLQRSFSAMCQEVIGGQYLELSIAHRAVPEGPPGETLERELLEVLRLKSGRYTAERPIELGALLAGAAPEVSEALARYGRAVGEAFQLQDDLLGVFGDASRVGKPVGADLVEGKLTFLIYHALRLSSPGQRSALVGTLGSSAASAADLERAAGILEETGARRAVEEMVEARLTAARQALDLVAGRLGSEGGAALSELIEHLRGREA